MVGPCGGHARKDGRTGFSRAAPATLQCLRWPYWVLKRSACRASTFKMAVLCSQALHLPHFNLYDGRTGVLKRCTCRASTLKMAVQGSQALRLRASTFKMAVRCSQVLRPSRKTNGICRIIVQTKSPTKPPRCGENTILVLRARRF